MCGLDAWQNLIPESVDCHERDRQVRGSSDA